MNNLIEQYLSAYALKVNRATAARAGDHLRAFARRLAKGGACGRKRHHAGTSFGLAASVRAARA